ncbi:17-beta-hydroxysteroid dehydrogenase type 6-like isoform X6 [Ruditapes philippinarum]|uniref:17-beta-hydroxysteroid dehydrogenase type 6-like isoform X6 n=1 Tax=Ruditapes philippinarum TaxID=129788 RepID=UPI00295B5C57|nr:17-beta-hydroxysteroid dehydrogenase type 6-like isoform X6 [Ruditapes philippinarum]
MDKDIIATVAGVVSVCIYFLGYMYVAVIGAIVAVILWFKKEEVEIKNKAVLITGCDSGFGNQIARRLDKKGFTVFAGCLLPDREGAKQLKAECSDRLHIIHVDVTDDWLVRGAVKYVKENLGKNELWAVVNNAGIAIFTEIEWCSVIQFQRIFDVNVLGVVRVTKAFLPLIRQANGRIVNVASLAGRFTMPAFAAYSMSKRACIAFSDALRIEMKKFNVKVVTIEPALYKTPISETGYLEAQNRKSWSETPTEVKEAYGDEYFDAFLENIGTQMKRAKSNINEVIDLMENAVTDVTPKIRYVPSSSIIRATILTYLPSKVTDKLFQIYTPKVPPRHSTSSGGSVSDNDVTH